MPRHFFAAWLLLAAATLHPHAQPTSRPAPIRSPELAADNAVTFRLRAPKAGEVVLNGQWPNGRVPLVKDGDGVWSATIGQIPAGVWEYSFQLDGVGMIDPANPAIKPMREPRTSILHLPGNPPLPHDFQQVPHGVVREHAYLSKPLGRLRQLTVYTPPGYDAQTSTSYPTLYLQHGSGDNNATWVAHGKAHWILDNLLAKGQAKPMVVVMMDGHAATPGGPAGQDNTALFERDLLEEVMPLVESYYRVLKNPASRALAGLSMGGGQALNVGLNHIELFGWIGAFSAAPPDRQRVAAALGKPDKTNADLKLLWIACGKEDFLLKRNQDFIQVLADTGVKHQWLLTEGNHSWPVWRLYLADFAPLLF